MADGTGPVHGAQLRAVVERIERLEAEKREVAEAIREVYAEAKGNGFDVKAIRRIVALRKKDAAERAEEEAILETYMAALGMLADTPLGEAAVARDMGGRLHGRLVGAGFTPTGPGAYDGTAALGRADARVGDLPGAARPDRLGDGVRA